ncbi:MULTISPECIES: hypothetical protein [unclassified Bradyrhizobium]|jgi:hypothetical protein|uniref:hypothetical protein n=1 Tax=unclassified Bradyrhizobium TaxID=2631580 RepID=UPI0030D49688
MKRAATRVVAGIMLLGGMSWAQAADDRRIAQLRACPEGMECPEKSPRASAPRPANPTGNWIVSLTTSPIDYSPVATATTSSRDAAGGAGMTLSIRCHGGRSELIVAGPGVSGRGDDYAISYRVNDDQTMQIAAAVPASGIGVAFGGDVVRLLQSLPGNGGLNIHLTSRKGPALDAAFPLGGLDAVRVKIAAACKWPQPVAKPNG